MRAAFIVNNTAGRNNTSQLWSRLEPALRKINPNFSVFFTSRRGGGTEAAMTAQAQGFHRLIVVGGDGTLHEVVNGIDPAKTVVGIIPTGTGNDFCRAMGIPVDPFASISYIFSDNLCAVDLGCVNGHRFLNIAGVGFDAEAAKRVNESRILHWISGSAAYLASVFMTLFSYRNTCAHIHIDGETVSGAVFLAAVGNGRYYGGGIKMVPQAIMDDGLFHVTLGLDIKLLDALALLPKVFSGKHTDHHKVTCLTGRQVTISSSVPMTVHADGEMVSVTPAYFQIIPSCLRVVCPQPHNQFTGSPDLP